MGQGVVDLVDRLCQRGQAFRHRFQPGSRRRKAGPLLRGSSLCGGHRGQPVLRQKCRRCQPGPGTEQQGKGISGRLNAEHPGHAPARVGGEGFDASARCQQGPGGTGAGKPGCCRAEGRVCGTEGGPGHSTVREGGGGLAPAAEGKLDGGTDRHAKAEQPQRNAAQRCRCPGRDQQHPDAGRFGREPPQRKAQRRRQQSIRSAGQQEIDPAARGAEGKADGSQPQRPAARQRGRAEPARPKPPRSHGGPHRTEQTETVQRQRPEPMEQEAQQGPCRPGGEAVLREPQRQPQAEGQQRAVQHGPPAEEPGQKCRPLPQRRADGGPRHQRRRKGVRNIRFQNFEHEKSPLSGGDLLSLFCFPRRLHIL